MLVLVVLALTNTSCSGSRVRLILPLLTTSTLSRCVASEIRCAAVGGVSPVARPGKRGSAVTRAPWRDCGRRRVPAGARWSVLFRVPGGDEAEAVFVDAAGAVSGS